MGRKGLYCFNSANKSTIHMHKFSLVKKKKKSYSLNQVDKIWVRTENHPLVRFDQRTEIVAHPVQLMVPLSNLLLPFQNNVLLCRKLFDIYPYFHEIVKILFCLSL